MATPTEVNAFLAACWNGSYLDLTRIDAFVQARALGCAVPPDTSVEQDRNDYIAEMSLGGRTYNPEAGS